MRCIVVDDERIAREGLNEFIKEFDFLENVGSFSNAHLALDKLKTEVIDLIFLDIQMPFLNGYEFAKMIADKQTMIIFTTAYSDYALKGYKVNAIEYLLKPIFFEDFQAAVFKAKKQYELIYKKEMSIKPLFFKENGVLIKVNVTQITHIQALQNYVEIYLENEKKIIVHQTLKNILEDLPKAQFLQIHKSYIINTNYITTIDNLKLFIKEIELPIARGRKKEVMKKLNS